MTAAWSTYGGNRSTSVLWTIAQREGREERFLTPDQAVSAMTMVPGYPVNAWAAEPMIVQPMAFCWDDRGRLWVAENLDYETRGRGFSNAGNSRILILEDTNRDGVADSRKVFMEGIVFPSAIAVGFDGVFVGAPPNLLFVPDRDGDDKADMADIEVRLTGWGIRDRHEVVNSLHWGPDGWLYGLQGLFTSSKIETRWQGRLFKPGEPFPEDILEGDGVEINGGVWRYHPTEDRFEVVAHGFSNPWGIDYDARDSSSSARASSPTCGTSSRRRLSATGWPALQPVHLRRYSDDRRSSSSVGARRGPRLSIRCLSRFPAGAALHGQHP